MTGSRGDLVPAPDLRSVFNEVFYHLYTNSNLPRAERLGGEMIRLVLCKVYDEMHNGNGLQFRAGADEPVESVAARVRNLFDSVKSEYSDVIEATEQILLDSASVAYVVSRLQDISLLRTRKDAVGDAFEVFIGPSLRGEKGQFFTPRAVVRLCVQMLDPVHTERVLDPASGTGGFLVVALEHVGNDIREHGRGLPEAEIQKRTSAVASENFFGIDKESDLAKVCKAYLAIIGDGRGDVFCADSLADPKTWGAALRKKISLGSFDVVLTNPPFGAKIPIKSKALLQQYDLGFRWNKNRKTGDWTKTETVTNKQTPQVLFIERCLQLLKPGGRMAIVLPEGLFGNPSDGYIFKYVFSKAKVLAVVSCPHETFQPGTHIKTSVLFLEKTVPRGDYDIFMAIARKAGHDKNGKVIYRIDDSGHAILDDKGEKIVDDDLPAIAERYRLFEENGRRLKEFRPLGFAVSSGRIKDNILIPDYYDPGVADELRALADTGKYALTTVQSLVDDGVISIGRGNEVGSQFYGRGDVPFVRTTDIVNWETRVDPVKCVPDEIYRLYAKRQGLREGDILFVNDGTFLIGRSAMVTELDTRIVIQSHVRRIRVLKPARLDPFLLFYLLNTKAVRKQIEDKTFIQATISTLGNRLREVHLPIPRDDEKRRKWADDMMSIIKGKVELRRRCTQALEI